MGESIRILVVDDEDSIRKRCVRLLARHGHDVVGAADSLAALEIIRKRPCDLVIADIRMPGMDGIALLQEVKAFDPSIEVVMMTGYGAVETAVKSMKSGAFDYLTKPFETDELLHVVRNVAEKKSLQREIAQLRGKLRDQDPLLMIGRSPAMNRVSRFVQKVAPVDCTVLLYGESGTGKELVAKCIHGASPRNQHLLVVADCAALAGALLESELFGHVRGAFTGAHSDRKGYFESAHRGTIFLDEIGELPLDLQGKLLRAVDENVIFRLGSSLPVRVDVRVIAATNKNLEVLVAKGAFREDLFYRLNVVSLTIPPLRDRREDIPLLAKRFLNRYSAQLNVASPPRMSQKVLDLLCQYDWPGNVRELENAIQRALVLAEDDQLSPRHLLPTRPLHQPEDDGEPSGKEGSFHDMREQVVQEFTRSFLESCLRRNGGNITRTAKEIGMRRTSLQRLLKKAGLQRHGIDGKDAS